MILPEDERAVYQKEPGSLPSSLPEGARQSTMGKKSVYQRETVTLQEEEQVVYQRDTGILPEEESAVYQRETRMLPEEETAEYQRENE